VYLRLNPNGLVPTIADDGFVLWEATVIVRYLAATHGMGTLCPEDLTERTRRTGGWVGRWGSLGPFPTGFHRFGPRVAGG
jgi:glutathione S-transferase